MPAVTDFSAQADQVSSIHAPWQATVDECLKRWETLGLTKRSQSYLVLHGEAGARRTLDASAIAELVELSGRQHQHTS